MLDLLRTSIHRVIASKAGDSFAPVRVPKDMARRVNMVLGEPICSREELARRRTAHAKLMDLRSGKVAAATNTKKREAAPVVVYFEGDRNARMLGRIKEALDGRNIPYTSLDVAGDETTKDFVMREAKCKEDELPIVFVAAAPIGNYNELVAWDVAGKLEKAVYGS